MSLDDRCDGPPPNISFDIHYNSLLEKPPCCDELQYIYPWIQRGLCVITATINIFGVWIVRRRTPPSMRDFSRYLTYHQIAAANIDLQLSVLGCPSFLFPMLGVHMHGFYSLLNFGGLLQLAIFLASAGAYIATVLFMLLARQQAILPAKNFFHIQHQHLPKAVIVIFILILSLTMPIAGIYPNPQYPAKAEYQAYYPCRSLALWDDNTFVLEHKDESTVITIVNILVALFIFLTGILTIPTVYLLHCGSKIMSEKRRKMQTVFFLSLIIQITLPMAITAGPVLLFAVSGHNFYNRLPFNNLIIHIVSIHGAVSTITMIFSYRSYRVAIFTMLGFKKTTKVHMINVEPRTTESQHTNATTTTKLSTILK